MGEIIKHGLIKEEDYYSWLKEHIEDIKAKDYEVLRNDSEAAKSKSSGRRGSQRKRRAGLLNFDTPSDIPLKN